MTGFTDYGSTVADHNNDEVFTVPFLPSMPDSDMKHISDILSRYQRVDTYNGTGVYTKPLANIVDDLPAFDKLRGFLGFSGTFNIKLTWNADPSIMGMYILAYTPPSCGVPDEIQGGNGHRIFLSGCPHVVINIAETTSATLSIPYVGESNVIPLYPYRPSDSVVYRILLGKIHIIELVPLQSSTSPLSLDMSIFLSITDLKTYGVWPGVSRVQSVAFAEVAEAVKKNKVVSSTFGSISKFLNANKSPSFGGTLARAGGWAFGAAAKISDLLGWSKPLDVGNLTGVVPLPYRDLCTSDATFVGAKMSMNYDQGISDVDLSGRGIDEMAISTILNRPNIAVSPGTPAFPTLRKSFPVGTRFAVYDVSPSSFWSSENHKTGDKDYIYTTYSHMTYLSKLFEFWRGSIRFHIRPVCTKFHSARIRIVFVPGQEEVTSQDIVKNMQYTYAHVLDIRDSTTFDVEIPFVHTFPWMKTNRSVGRLYFFVENPLVAPENVSDTIQFAVFVSAGQDFEFAVPRVRFGDDELPYPMNTSLTAKEHSVVKKVLPSTQGVLHVQSWDGIANVVNIAPDTSTDSVTAHSMSIGDPVRSLRALLKKFWVAGKFPANQTKFFLSSEPSSRSSATVGTKNVLDPIAYVTWMYGFHRGGMRWYAQNYYPGRVAMITRPTDDAMTPTGIGPLSDDFDPDQPQIVTLGINDSGKFEIPYYNDSVCVNHWQHGNKNSSGLVYDYWLGTGNQTVFCRALADDFSFGYLVGAPTTIRPAE